MAGISGALRWLRSTLAIEQTAGVITMFGLFGVAERLRKPLVLQNLALDNQANISLTQG